MANLTDKITDVRNAARPNSARVTSGRSAGGNTLACDNLSGWPTASKVHFVTYKVNSSSVVVAGTQLDCEGIVSGNNIGSFTVIDGADTGHAVGDYVEMLPTAAWGQDLADALSVGHARTGTHSANLPLTTPVLTTPTIADFTSATHSHANAAGGGQIANAGISGVGSEKLANPYKFSVYRTAALVSSNSFTVIAFDTKTFDTSSNVDVVTNKGRFTAPIAGFYWFASTAGNTAAVNTQMGIRLLKNGVAAQTGGIGDPSQASGANLFCVTGFLQLAINDYVEVAFIGGAGSVMNVGATDCWFNGFLVSTT